MIESNSQSPWECEYPGRFLDANKLWIDYEMANQHLLHKLPTKARVAAARTWVDPDAGDYLFVNTCNEIAAQHPTKKKPDRQHFTPYQYAFNGFAVMDLNSFAQVYDTWEQDLFSTPSELGLLLRSNQMRSNGLEDFDDFMLKTVLPELNNLITYVSTQENLAYRRSKLVPYEYRSMFECLHEAVDALEPVFQRNPPLIGELPDLDTIQSFAEKTLSALSTKDINTLTVSPEDCKYALVTLAKCLRIKNYCAVNEEQVVDEVSLLNTLGRNVQTQIGKKDIANNIDKQKWYEQICAGMALGLSYFDIEAALQQYLPLLSERIAGETLTEIEVDLLSNGAIYDLNIFQEYVDNNPNDFEMGTTQYLHDVFEGRKPFNVADFMTLLDRYFRLEDEFNDSSSFKTAFLSFVVHEPLDSEAKKLAHSLIINALEQHHTRNPSLRVNRSLTEMMLFIASHARNFR